MRFPIFLPWGKRVAALTSDLGLPHEWSSPRLEFIAIINAAENSIATCGCLEQEVAPQGLEGTFPVGEAAPFNRSLVHLGLCGNARAIEYLEQA